MQNPRTVQWSRTWIEGLATKTIFSELHLGVLIAFIIKELKGVQDVDICRSPFPIDFVAQPFYFRRRSEEEITPPLRGLVLHPVSA